MRHFISGVCTFFMLASSATLGGLLGHSIGQKNAIIDANGAFDRGVMFGEASTRACPEPELTIAERQKVKVYEYEYGKMRFKFQAANFEVMELDGTMEQNLTEIQAGSPLTIRTEKEIQP